MSRVIIDTSAWIESFRPKGDARLKETVKRLIIEGAVLLPGIIKVEILRGTKSQEEYNRLDELLRGLIYLPVEEGFWERLSGFSFKLLRQGVTVPLTDTYIALIAMENNVPILHCDRHFDLIAQRDSLEIFNID
ncbi:MAG: PIN domain nuclease [Chloroflexota bacterium]|nr:PIN domain nuclease [Chloroflexota bacterium]